MRTQYKIQALVLYCSRGRARVIKAGDQSREGMTRLQIFPAYIDYSANCIYVQFICRNMIRNHSYMGRTPPRLQMMYVPLLATDAK